MHKVEASPFENSMRKAKILLCITLACVLVLSQVAVAFAAPKRESATLITGMVIVASREVDRNSGTVTFAVTVQDDVGGKRIIRVTEETAYELGLIDYDDDGNSFILETLPAYIEIDPAVTIPEPESHHPVATALATFFSDIEGVDYNIIMDAHAVGNGFGVIAQALWLIQKLDGNAEDFALLLEAKKSGDYSQFVLEDGTVPTSWGQLRKAVAENLGTVISHNDRQNEHPNSNKDKPKDKSNHGNENVNSNGNGHGNNP